MVNKHTVDYHPSPSQLISRIHPLIFLWTPKGHISLESFLNFFLNLYIPLWLRKSFKFIVLRLLQIHLWVKKLNLLDFTHAPQAKLSSRFLSLPPRQTGTVLSSRTAFFEDIFFPEEKGWRGWGLWSWKNYQNWQRYRSQVLINFTIFATFPFLVYVLLCNNLASCNLTNKIFS